MTKTSYFAADYFLMKMQSNNNTKPPTITLSMIVKNEEKYLRGCLTSIKDVVDEIILVDTGSTDSTIEIAKEFAAKIFRFDWVNDFSAARNFALQKSTGDWILYLDADERLSESSIKELLDLTKFRKNVGVFCTVKSNRNISGNSSMMKYTRLFRNVTGLKFAGKVHEQIESSLKENGCKLIDSDIEINHLGYDVDESKIVEKADRNLKLLLSDFETNPTGYNAFQLGQTYNILNQLAEGNKYFKLAIEDSALELHHRAQSYRQLAAFELINKNYDLAENLADKGIALVPESPLLNIVKANILLEKGMDSQAVKYCKIAYKNNHDFITNKKKSQLEQTVVEKNILLYGINLSIIAVDSDLFNFFYAKLMKQNIEDDDNKIIQFYKKIFSNEEISAAEINDTLMPPSKIDYKILIKNLLNYKILKYKIEIIKAAVSINVNNEPIRKLLLEFFFSQNLVESVEYLEAAYEFDPQNLEVGFQLLNAYLNENKITELKLFIEKAKKSYAAYPNIVEKLKNIQATLLSLQK